MSGEEQLTPAGADALREGGSILEDFAEYEVRVEVHTDNRPIMGEPKKQFSSNQALSEERAANAVDALTRGGLSGGQAVGLADTEPAMSNTTAEGRAKNRLVVISVRK